MTRTRYVAGALLVAALASVGCSKKGKKAREAASAVNPQATVVATAKEPASATPHDNERPAPAATVTAPSYADGEAAYQAKKYGEAVAIFEAYVERRPHNGWGHYMLGLAAWKNSEPEKSELAFAKALSIDPRHLKSHINLSRVLIDQKRHDEALVHLTRAADIDPDSLEVRRLLGRTYHALGKTEEAETAYRTALELNERDAWSLNYLGSVLLDTKRPDEALPLLIHAVELRKDVAEFHNNLGLALEQTGSVRAAATAFGSALRVDPTFEPAKQNLARVDAR